MSSKNRIALYMNGAGTVIRPIVLKNFCDNLRVHPKETCFDIDYRILEKKPNTYIHMAYNFVLVQSLNEMKREQIPTINWTATRILLDHELLAALEDDCVSWLPKDEVIFFKVENGKAVDYRMSEFKQDWPQFFKPPRYLHVPKDYNLNNVLEKMVQKTKSRYDNHYKALMLLSGKNLLKKFKESAPLLTARVPPLPAWKTIGADNAKPPVPTTKNFPCS